VEVVSVGSGYIVDRLTDWLRDKVVDGHYVLVWEVQKRGAPHLHLMFRLQGDDHIKRMYSNIRTQWHQILRDVSQDAGVNLLLSPKYGDLTHEPKKLNCNFKAVNRDYAAYISKYVSKSESKKGGKFSFRPGRWWGLSESLRALVHKNRFEEVFEIESPAVFTDFIGALSDRGFDLFDKLICFPKKEQCRPDVYSFECGASGARTTAISIGAWLAYGDLTLMEEISRVRKQKSHSSEDRRQPGTGAEPSYGRWDAHAEAL